MLQLVGAEQLANHWKGALDRSRGADTVYSAVPGHGGRGHCGSSG